MQLIWELLGLLIRQGLLLLINWINANPNVAQFLGDDVVKFLKEESTITQIVAWTITGLITGWQLWSRVIKKAQMKAAASGAPTTIAEVKMEVAQMSAGEKITQALKPDTDRR